MQNAVLRIFCRYSFVPAFVALLFLASCAEEPKAVATRAAAARRMAKVRTTAYTRGERGGKHNAMGSSLAGRHVMSAASDWSRFPLGTHFRIVGTSDEYMIDDYGVALVGTNTIDLYKPSRLEMKRWGVRRVDIDVLEWGSPAKSLKVLAPRAHHSYIRHMIADLQKKSGASRPVWADD